MTSWRLQNQDSGRQGAIYGQEQAMHSLLSRIIHPSDTVDRIFASGTNTSHTPFPNAINTPPSNKKKRNAERMLVKIDARVRLSE
jgi:hypothetical protein